jgi:hypothetical protein
MNRSLRSTLLFLGSVCAALPAPVGSPRGVDEIVEAYVIAAGGAKAIAQIHSREVRGRIHFGAPVTYYWQEPDKVLRIGKHERSGFNGSSGWTYTRSKRTRRLARGAETPMLIDANPLRYVHLRQLYADLNAAPAETFDARRMDVLIAPNNLGATKFYFDAQSHLLRKLEETGETSVYYKSSTEFSNYQPINGVQFPFRIVHSTNQPGGANEDFRVSQVINNVALGPQVFDSRSGGAPTHSNAPGRSRKK